MRICNESEELKDLEKKLKTAYMNKERAAQHEERMLRQRRDILREKAIDDAMEADRIAAEIADQEKGGSKKNVTARQKAGLEKQMKEREYVLRCYGAFTSLDGLVAIREGAGWFFEAVRTASSDREPSRSESRDHPRARLMEHDRPSRAGT